MKYNDTFMIKYITNKYFSVIGVRDDTFDSQIKSGGHFLLPNIQASRYVETDKIWFPPTVTNMNDKNTLGFTYNRVSEQKS